MPSKSEWKQLCRAAAWVAVGNLAGRPLAWPLWALYNEIRAELNREQKIQRSSGNIAFTDSLVIQEISNQQKMERDQTILVDTKLHAHELMATAIRSGRITTEEAQVIWRTRSLEVSTSTAAQELGITPQTLRKRRSRAERRLKAAA